MHWALCLLLLLSIQNTYVRASKRLLKCMGDVFCATTRPGFLYVSLNAYIYYFEFARVSMLDECLHNSLLRFMNWTVDGDQCSALSRAFALSLLPWTVANTIAFFSCALSLLFSLSLSLSVSLPVLYIVTTTITVAVRPEIKRSLSLSLSPTLKSTSTQSLRLASSLRCSTSYW